MSSYNLIPVVGPICARACHNHCVQTKEMVMLAQKTFLKPPCSFAQASGAHLLNGEPCQAPGFPLGAKRNPERCAASMRGLLRTGTPAPGTCAVISQGQHLVLQAETPYMHSRLLSLDCEILRVTPMPSSQSSHPVIWCCALESICKEEAWQGCHESTEPETPRSPSLDTMPKKSLSRAVTG